MRIVIEYQGKRYEGIETNKNTAEEAAEIFFKSLDITTKINLSLPGGGALILGKDAVQNAVIMFLP